MYKKQVSVVKNQREKKKKFTRLSCKRQKQTQNNARVLEHFKLGHEMALERIYPKGLDSVREHTRCQSVSLSFSLSVYLISPSQPQLLISLVCVYVIICLPLPQLSSVRMIWPKQDSQRTMPQIAGAVQQSTNFRCGHCAYLSWHA